MKKTEGCVDFMRVIDFERIDPPAYNDIWRRFIGADSTSIGYFVKALQNFFHDDDPKRIYMFILFSHGPLTVELKRHEKDLRKVGRHYLEKPTLWDWLKEIEVAPENIPFNLNYIPLSERQYWETVKIWNEILPPAFIKRLLTAEKFYTGEIARVNIKKNLRTRFPLKPNEVVCIERYLRGYAGISNKKWRLTAKTAQEYFGDMRWAIRKNSENFLQQLEIAIGSPRPISILEMFLETQINTNLFAPFHGPYCDLKSHNIVELNESQYKKLVMKSNKEFLENLDEKLYKSRKAIEAKRKWLKAEPKATAIDRSRFQIG